VIACTRRAAVQLAGLRVFPVHESDGADCSCGPQATVIRQQFPPETPEPPRLGKAGSYRQERDCAGSVRQLRDQQRERGRDRHG